MPSKITSPLWTNDQASQYLQVKPRTLVQWRYLGRGPRYVKTGRDVCYLKADLDAWIEQQAANSMPAGR